jgi:hypothetical protein
MYKTSYIVTLYSKFTIVFYGRFTLERHGIELFYMGSSGGSLVHLYRGRLGMIMAQVHLLCNNFSSQIAM